MAKPDIAFSFPHYRKYQAFYGTLMALALIDIMDAALQGLVTMDSSNPQELLNKLRAEQENDQARFMASDLTIEARDNILKDPAIDMKLVVRTRPMCRTARLPAQSRYLGIMTERPDKISYTNYELGTVFEQARLNPNTDSKMRLVYDEPHDARNCVVPLTQDFKDYYMVTPKDGWQSLLVPNDVELDYYKTSEPLKGLVMIALGGCGWHCPAGDLREDAFATGAINMEVNGIKVTNVSTAWGGTFLKHGEDGSNAYFPVNEQGRYDIRARVSGDGSFMRIGGVVIW